MDSSDVLDHSADLCIDDTEPQEDALLLCEVMVTQSYNSTVQCEQIAGNNESYLSETFFWL